MAFNSKPPTMVDGSPEEFAQLTRFLADVAAHLNGGMSLIKDTASKPVEVTFRNAAQEQPVNHGLKRVPEGYTVIGSDTDGAVVSETTRSRTADRIYLQCSQADAMLKLLFF